MEEGEEGEDKKEEKWGEKKVSVGGLDSRASIAR